jgi:hypothetical protein
MVNFMIFTASVRNILDKTSKVPVEYGTSVRGQHDNAHKVMGR